MGWFRRGGGGGQGWLTNGLGCQQNHKGGAGWFKDWELNITQSQPAYKKSHQFCRQGRIWSVATPWAKLLPL